MAKYLCCDILREWAIFLHLANACPSSPSPPPRYWERSYQECCYREVCRGDSRNPYGMMPIFPILSSSTPRCILVCPNGRSRLRDGCVDQLLESYLSRTANPFTDALALDALGRVGNALPLVLSTRSDEVRLWGEMAYCAYISGVIMGSAGLGYVHSIAGSMGAFTRYRMESPAAICLHPSQMRLYSRCERTRKTMWFGLKN